MSITRKNLKALPGFTLIELLIVIAIIGILTGVVLTNLTGARERARDARRKQDLKQVQTALQLFSNDIGFFPTDNGSGSIVGCGPNSTNLSACTWGSSTFSIGSIVYMGTLPKDPLSDSNAALQYRYEQDATVDYILTAQLENASDPDSTASQQRCGQSPIQSNLFVLCNQ